MKTFEILQIDAWMDGNDEWYWNDIHVLGSFTTKAKDEKRAFLQALKKMGIEFKKGSIRIEDDYDYITILTKKDDEPIVSAKYIGG